MQDRGPSGEVQDALRRARNMPRWRNRHGSEEARDAVRDRAVLAAEVVRLGTEYEDWRQGYRLIPQAAGAFAVTVDPYGTLAGRITPVEWPGEHRDVVSTQVKFEARRPYEILLNVPVGRLRCFDSAEEAARWLAGAA